MKHIKKYPQIFIVFLLALLIGAFLIAINSGSIKVTPLELLNGLFIEYNEKVASIYLIRFPRVIIMFLAGGALALSGLLFQVVLKNPLADPGIIGISSGAYLVSLLAGIFFPQFYQLRSLLSIVGGIVIFIVIYMLSWKSDFKTTTIILTGVAINYTMNAVITLIESASASLVSTGTGTISLYTWNDVKLLLVCLLPVMVVTLFMAKGCQLLGLSDHTLISLGINVVFYRFGLSFLAVVLCSVSVAVTGVIGFIGLIIPHFARLFIGHEYRYLLPVSLLLGAVVLLLTDTLGRMIIAPYEISSAIIMALIGGPLLIVLLRRSKCVHEG